MFGSEPGSAVPIQTPSRIFGRLPPDARSSPHPATGFAVGRLTPPVQPPLQNSSRSSPMIAPVQVFRRFSLPLQPQSRHLLPPLHPPLQPNHPAPASRPDHRHAIQPPVQPPHRIFQPAPPAPAPHPADPAGPAAGLVQLHFIIVSAILTMSTFFSILILIKTKLKKSMVCAQRRVLALLLPPATAALAPVVVTVG